MVCKKCIQKMKVIDTQNIDNTTHRTYKCPECENLLISIEVINNGNIIFLDSNKIKNLEMYND